MVMTTRMENRVALQKFRYYRKQGDACMENARHAMSFSSKQNNNLQWRIAPFCVVG